MKRKIHFISLLVALVFVSSSLAQKPDFSGTWNLNTEKSQLPRMGRGMGGPATLTITHDDPQISMVSVLQSPRGERKIEFELTLGGEDVKVSMNMGETVYKGYWSEDGKSIIIESEMEMGRGGRSFSMSSKQTYSLSDDGKVLTCKQVRSTPRGDMESTLVYDKQ